jgi:hypothetical protein
MSGSCWILRIPCDVRISWLSAGLTDVIEEPNHLMKKSLIIALSTFVTAGFAGAAGAPELIRLHEEEILAHELYVALAEVHPELMPLRNIPLSEARHREVMAAVLKEEKIPIPEVRRGRKFSSEGLDALYLNWLEEGRKSPTAACLVGVRLEEHDIADLRKAQIAFPAHKEVLAQLEAASNNHLRAFYRNLIRHGGEYKPEVLTAAEFKAILDGVQGGDCGACGEGQGKGGGPGNGGGRGRGMGRRAAAEVK